MSPGRSDLVLPARLGVTLPELLVTMAVLGLFLTGVLLTWQQAARLSRAQTEMTAQLRDADHALQRFVSDLRAAEGPLRRGDGTRFSSGTG